MLSNNNGKLEAHEVVPWRSREEWLEVCELIYSNNTSELQEAYEKLRCWKARCHRVPAGIECTLMILEPMLMEKKLNVSSNDLIIKSVYSLAITRFLNTAASFRKEKVPTTLYRIAESLNIPEWIVNIRHESAHGPDLPSLDVLRNGVQFCLQWLRSAYWEKGLIEDQQPESNLITSYDPRDQLQKWCEIYQGVYFHKLKNIFQTKDIKDLKLMQKVKEYLGDDGSMSVDEEDSETLEGFPSTINALMNQLVMRLNSVYSDVVKSGYEVQKVLKCFLEVSEFLPSKRTLQKYISGKDESGEGTTWHMRKMWTKIIMDVIQNHGALLLFMNELVNYNSGDLVKDLIASYWVRDIAKAIVLAQVALQVEESASSSSRQTNYYTKEQEIEIYLKAKKIYRSSIWENAMRLSLNNIPTTDELVESVILSPRKHTRIYLSNLMETTKRKLSEDKKKKIMKFVDLILNQTCYTGDNACLNEKIYVMNNAENDSSEAEEQLETTDSGSANLWKGVPFGSLPLCGDL